jgi:hypothetical protein
VHARRLVGGRITGVRYFEIDYWRIARADSDEVQRGGRVVTSAEEWTEPSWRASDCDSVDFGAELTTENGAVFSAVWVMADDNEGLSFRQEPLRPKRLEADGAFALWDVERAGRWSPFIVSPVKDVRLCWTRPFSSSDLCCHAIELLFDSGLVVLTLGEQRSGEFSYASDNLAAVFGEQSAQRLRVGRFES